MTISDNGNVGIGTTTPTNAKLDVVGAAVSRANIIATGETVNLALSNVHTLRAPASATITLQNPAIGGTYTIVISDTTSRTYTFAGCENSYFVPANGATEFRSSYTILMADDPDSDGIPDCYINWTTGFN